LKVRKVGSLTCGILLILFGVLCFVQMFLPMLNYGIILKLWPVILIMLGGEMLFSNFQKKYEKIIYDIGAILLTMTLAVFAMVMGILEYCVEIGGVYL